MSVTTWARDEDTPRVSLFDVAKPDPKDAINAIRRACGAPAKMVAIKTHLTTGALALMRVKQGELRMRKSFKQPRNINQLTQRILDIGTSEDEDRGSFGAVKRVAM